MEEVEGEAGQVVALEQSGRVENTTAQISYVYTSEGVGLAGVTAEFDCLQMIVSTRILSRAWLDLR